MKLFFLSGVLFLYASMLFPHRLQAQSERLSEIRYLSGTDKDHMVKWQFYCTSGMNAGKWTTIGVPSCWELQGFGKYNYGTDKDSLQGKEVGFYKEHFYVPACWKNRVVRIVFEGSMTDTKVKINGHLAGPVHQGAFYCFRYDISSLLRYGKKNLLEVEVHKYSGNWSVNKAERRGDFWIFGGIFRPVYLESLPGSYIDRVAVDGKADGQFSSRVFVGHAENGDSIKARIYDMAGNPVGDPFMAPVQTDSGFSDVKTLVANFKTWTPESPNLYKVDFQLLRGSEVLHETHEKFGFRTIELRQRDGIYLNGVKIKFKGVNHHSFYPNSGRTTSKELSIADVSMLKDMNMNAVRMSHYPPDSHFLDACDSMGLMVLDELTGWHMHYDDTVGAKLVKEMIAYDQNHPSILLWDNGNEGGFNFNLDPLFDSADYQHRPLIHPWLVFRGTDTQHYINYDYGNGTHLHGHNITFPTEFLHGLYDGGAGAGLEDYWEQMWSYPLSAGGFLWDFADEGVARTDQHGRIDTYGDQAPDGIVGPYHEKEGSYYTIKKVWSPVYFEHREITNAFDGRFTLENRYFFTNLKACRFSWTLKRFSLNALLDSVSGNAVSPDLEPGHKGILSVELPNNWSLYDVLYITCTDPFGKQIASWSFPITLPATKARSLVVLKGTGPVILKQADSIYEVRVGKLNLHFNAKNGLLSKVISDTSVIPLCNGPVLIKGQSANPTVHAFMDQDTAVIKVGYAPKTDLLSTEWRIYPSGWVKLSVAYFPSDYYTDMGGVSFSFPEAGVTSVRWLGDGPYRVWKNRMQGGSLDLFSKVYNNTSTGQDWIYPEFKGYYSRFYAMTLFSSSKPWTVVCADEDVFLRLFTPRFAAKSYNTAPAFPGGDISFMNAIPAIGTKSQKAEGTGPAGSLNMYYDYGKDPFWAKRIDLYFNFNPQ